MAEIGLIASILPFIKNKSGDITWLNIIKALSLILGVKLIHSLDYLFSFLT